MSDTTPAVALLFDDTELGGQLREALHARGARIVHEGGVSSLNRALLHQVGADVLVVNLDDNADDALDHLYELIDGDRPRVVFNDAQASRTLNGWDRARWARHLAVKVLAAGDLDPPRPEDARIIDTPSPVESVESAPAASAETPLAVAVVPTADSEEPALITEAEPMPSEPDFSAHADHDGQHEKMASAESESLAAELEALLASGELPTDDEDESGPGLHYGSDKEFPPLHDGNFGALVEASPANDASHAVGAAGGKSPDAAVISLDHLQLVSLDDSSVATIPASTNEPVFAGKMATPVSAPGSWALLDDDALLAERQATGREIGFHSEPYALQRGARTGKCLAVFLRVERKQPTN